MKKHTITRGLVSGLAIVAVFCISTLAQAQMKPGHMDGHGMKNGGKMDHKMSAGMGGMAPHGGAIEATKAFKFETVFTESDVRIYVMDADGTPVSAAKAKGSVSLEPKNKKGETAKIDLKWMALAKDPMAGNRLRPEAGGKDAPGYLTAPYDFRNTDDGALTVHVMLSDLPASNETTAHWATMYSRTPLFGKACPMHPEQASLGDGECSLCGGMKYQPTTVFYECCEACGDMRRTAPGTCEKCGMEFQVKAVKVSSPMEGMPAKSDHSGHAH